MAAEVMVGEEEVVAVAAGIQTLEDFRTTTTPLRPTQAGASLVQARNGRPGPPRRDGVPGFGQGWQLAARRDTLPAGQGDVTVSKIVKTTAEASSAGVAVHPHHPALAQALRGQATSLQVSAAQVVGRMKQPRKGLMII